MYTATRPKGSTLTTDVAVSVDLHFVDNEDIETLTVSLALMKNIGSV